MSARKQRRDDNARAKERDSRSRMNVARLSTYAEERCVALVRFSQHEGRQNTEASRPLRRVHDASWRGRRRCPPPGAMSPHERPHPRNSARPLSPGASVFILRSRISSPVDFDPLFLRGFAGPVGIPRRRRVFQKAGSSGRGHRGHRGTVAGPRRGSPGSRNIQSPCSGQPRWNVRPRPVRRWAGRSKHKGMQLAVRETIGTDPRFQCDPAWAVQRAPCG